MPGLSIANIIMGIDIPATVASAIKADSPAVLSPRLPVVVPVMVI